MLLETATLAGGCFWCTEAIFQRLKGVESVVSGYSGGSIDNPTYEQVSGGTTGHTEAIQIKFDPSVISFEKILDVFFATHDPTTLNRQGPDMGTQYRSVVFYHDEKQKQAAGEKIKILDQAFEAVSPQAESVQDDKGAGKIVTKVEPFTNFFTAESYHQNYYEINKNSAPYCPLIIDPKIQKLMREFSGDVKEAYKFDN